MTMSTLAPAIPPPPIAPSNPPLAIGAKRSRSLDIIDPSSPVDDYSDMDESYDSDFSDDGSEASLYSPHLHGHRSYESEVESELGLGHDGEWDDDGNFDIDLPPEVKAMETAILAGHNPQRVRSWQLEVQHSRRTTRSLMIVDEPEEKTEETRLLAAKKEREARFIMAERLPSVGVDRMGALYPIDQDEELAKLSLTAPHQLVHGKYLGRLIDSRALYRFLSRFVYHPDRDFARGNITRMTELANEAGFSSLPITQRPYGKSHVAHIVNDIMTRDIHLQKTITIALNGLDGYHIDERRALWVLLVVIDSDKAPVNHILEWELRALISIHMAEGLLLPNAMELYDRHTTLVNNLLHCHAGTTTQRCLHPTGHMRPELAQVDVEELAENY
ncbi:hypothetical protein IAT38_007044 [Cryptococcus sp. DSM 104549]